MPLFKKLSTLPIVDRKLSPEKWLREISSTSHGTLPVSSDSDGSAPFPWAQLRTHTTHFLRKRDLSELDRDLALCQLIASSPNKIIALAACSGQLSAKSIYELLATYQNDSGNTEHFLQAFVAASHDNSEIFMPTDEEWATILIQVDNRTRGHDVPPVNAVSSLLEKWCQAPLPTYPHLRDIVRIVTIGLLQKVNTVLEVSLSKRDWDRALEVSSCLNNFASRPDGLPQVLQDMLEWEINQWRHWAVWKPDRQKIALWRQYSDSFPVQPFWAGVGPDLETAGRGIYPTAMARVNAGGQLVHWMEENGLKPGFDIMVCESLEIISFSTHLTSVLNSSCKLGGVAYRFLQYIATSDEGLDQHTLQLWEDARDSLFEKSPAFLSAVLEFSNRHDSAMETVPNEVLAAGLSNLYAVGTSSLRDFLLPRITQMLAQTAKMLVFDFVEAVGATLSWLDRAEKLRGFGGLLGSVTGLKEIDVGWSRHTGTSCSKSSLENLQHLHWVVCDKNTAANLHTRVDFEDAFIKYITQTVLDTPGNHEVRVQLIAALHLMWNDEALVEHRAVALRLLALESISPSSRAHLIGGIGILPLAQVNKLETCLAEVPELDAIQVSYRIMRIAARVLQTYAATSEAWGALVHHVMGSYAFLPPDDVHFTKVSSKKYRSWITNYACVFNTHKCAVQSHAWIERLVAYIVDIESVRAMQDSDKAIHCIYTASKEPSSTFVINMLDAIKRNRIPERDELMRHCVLSLTDNHKHAEAVSQAVVPLASISNDGFELCKKLTIVAAQESVYIAAVQKDVWLGLETKPDTKKAMNHLAAALRLPPAQPEVAKDYFMKRIAAVVKEAQAVEDMRVKLIRHNRKGVAAVLSSLMIEEQSSALEEEIMDLPSDLMSVIEQVDNHNVEMHFSLTYMGATQRKAWGVSNGESVTVRLVIGDNGSRDAFCAHVVDPQADQASIKHDPLKHGTATTAPDTLRCEGRVTRLTYMIMRGMWHWLRKDDGMPLVDLYKKIEEVIKIGRNNCIVCGQSHPTPAKTYRPSVCIKPHCRETWLKSAREIRLVDLRLDESVVELLIVAIQAAATTMSNRPAGSTALELLPNRPARLNDTKKLLTLLNTIPKISTTFNTLDSLYSIQSKFSIRAELLLSWAMNNFRGFLMSAPPALQIPNMPGAKQFVVADSPPEIVAAFSQHDALQPRQVLFHGTTMDRLYAILCQGLKILSHTSLQTHGAAYGSGIYLAEAPATALSYSSISLCASPTFALDHHTHVNQKVLLGIEYAGNDVGRGNGIHVATDPTKVLLRYVFLLPSNFRAPIATHVVPAMQSNFYTLKSGARAT